MENFTRWKLLKEDIVASKPYVVVTAVIAVIFTIAILATK